MPWFDAVRVLLLDNGGGAVVEEFRPVVDHVATVSDERDWHQQDQTVSVGYDDEVREPSCRSKLNLEVHVPSLPNNHVWREVPRHGEIHGLLRLVEYKHERACGHQQCRSLTVLREILNRPFEFLERRRTQNVAESNNLLVQEGRLIRAMLRKLEEAVRLRQDVAILKAQVLVVDALDAASAVEREGATVFFAWLEIVSEEVCDRLGNAALDHLDRLCAFLPAVVPVRRLLLVQSVNGNVSDGPTIVQHELELFLEDRDQSFTFLLLRNPLITTPGEDRRLQLNHGIEGRLRAIQHWLDIQRSGSLIVGNLVVELPYVFVGVLFDNQ